MDDPQRAQIQKAFDLALEQQKAGHVREAIAAYRQLLFLLPESVEIRVNLGVALKDAGDLIGAISAFHEAIRFQPNSAKIWSNLGVAWRSKGALDEAISAFDKAIQLDPQSAVSWNNLGLTHQDAGSLDDAIRCFDRALSINPQLHAIASNRLHALHFLDRSDATSLLREHRDWAARFATSLKERVHAFNNERSLNRRLKIGYVSGDLREHAVGRFLLPLLAYHNRNQFEIYCYSSKAGQSDPICEKLRSYSHCWRDIANASDEDAAELIRDDRIDILVDLSMHMAHNRMLVFARKPAPIQVTYLAYCSTSGLDTIDYRFTDPHLDPVGQNENIYSEQSIHLPDTYWCYEPAIVVGEQNVLPAAHAGHVTFGCLNNFCKVTENTLNVWSELLQAVPTSRLILHAHAGKHRERTCQFLARRNIDPSRLKFVGFEPLTRYLELYRGIDIALDPFPYGGGTTTCDALWVGVPVITLVGRTAVGRGGASILSNLGLNELIAHTPEQYVNIGSALAIDLDRLTALHAGLRARMMESPLMKAEQFARNVESAYHRMWEHWCDRPTR